MTNKKMFLAPLMAACGASSSQTVFIVKPCPVSESPEFLSKSMLTLKTEHGKASVCPSPAGKKRQNNDFGHSKNCKWPGRKVQF